MSIAKTLIVLLGTLVMAIAVAAQTAATTQVFPTIPVATTKWKAGQAVTVQWTINNPAVTTQGLEIRLFHGQPAAMQLVASLGTAAPLATKFAVTLPATLDADWYSVAIGDSYSHYFIITNAAGVAPTGAAPTPVATSSSAAPSASSSSAAPSVTTSSSASASAPAATKTTSGSNMNKASVGALAVAALIAGAMAL